MIQSGIHYPITWFHFPVAFDTRINGWTEHYLYNEQVSNR
jgi:hypothetical protein